MEDLIKLINLKYDQLSENEKYILNYILLNREECLKLNVSELSKKSMSSPASIVRLSKKLGLSGFSELKYQLKSDRSSYKESSTSLDGCNYVSNLKHDIDLTIRLFEQMDLTHQYNLLKNSNYIYAYGTGTAQKTMLNELNRYMLSIGKNLIIIPSYNELEMVANSESDIDLMIIISLSEDTKNMQIPL